MTALSTLARPERKHMDILLIPRSHIFYPTEPAKILITENMMMIIVGAGAGGLLILMVAVIIIVTCHHKRKNKKLEKELTEKKYVSTMLN